MARILLAGLVGGIIVFIWGYVSHALLPVGKMGLKELSNEEAMMSALKSSADEPGVYMFPGGEGAATADWDALNAKYKAGPRGIIVIDPRPSDQGMMSPMQLGIEFASNALAALVAAMIVSVIAAATITRIFVVGLMGLFSWLSHAVSYWNWYKFPNDYIVADLVIEIVGWLAAGIFIAMIAPKLVAKLAPK
jgi:hypothetical protein